MIKPDIDALGVQERLLLFCLASGTDWKQAGVTLKTVVDMVSPFIGRTCLLVMTTSGGALALSDAGRAALRELLRDL
jgi:hypothetical protein